MTEKFDKDFDTGSPGEEEKKKIVALSFECTRNKAHSYQNHAEMYAFCENVDDLLQRLIRYMTPSIKDEIESIYTDMISTVEKIGSSQLTESKKNKEVLEARFEFYKKLHRYNCQVLPRSTVFEYEVAGELDITDEDAIGVIRGETGGKRSEIPARFGR